MGNPTGPIKIVSSTIDQGAMSPDFSPDLLRNASLLKFESVIHNSTPKPKTSFAANFFRALGNFAPLAYVAAPFTAGLSLIPGALFTGLGTIGARAQTKQIQEGLSPKHGGTPMMTSFPGMESASNQPTSDPTIQMIVSNRDDAASDALHR